MNRRRTILICLVLALGTAALYFPAAHFKFIEGDDRAYVIQNYRINQGWSLAGLAWCFQAGYASNWHPVTWMSHMFDCQLYGVGPGGAHVTNIFLHALNAALVFLALQAMTGAPWRSAMVAALFAWHPMHVESVAWIAERKDVLSTFFWLLTLAAYARYARHLEFQISNFKFYYVTAVLFYALAVMAKPMVVTLPLLLLLLDWWPLRRWQGGATGRRLVLEKVPFLLLSAICCVMTLRAQGRGGAIDSLKAVSLHFRMYNVAISYWRYIAKLLVPVKMASIYPILREHRSVPLAAVAALSLLAVSGTVIWFRKKRPYWLVGWFWFVGTLVPVIGVIQVGAQTMADRYTYVPSLGLFIFLCWTIADGLTGRDRGRVGIVLAGLALAGCAATTARQLQYWRDGETLFTHAIAVTDRNYEAHESYAEYLVNQGRWGQAEGECHRALEIENEFDAARLWLGVALFHEGKLDEAEREIPHDLRDPWNGALAEEYLGKIALRRNQPAQAETHFTREVRLNGDLPAGHYGLGEAFAREGKQGLAQEEFQKVSQLSPKYREQ